MTDLRRAQFGRAGRPRWATVVAAGPRPVKAARVLVVRAAAVVMLAACAAIFPRSAAAQEDAAPPAAGFAAWSATLGDAKASFAQKLEAARRLDDSAARGDTTSRRVLVDALGSAANKPAQLAAARAIAASTDRQDPAFVNPLFALLGTDRELATEAAAALASYQQTDVLKELIVRVRKMNGGESRPPIARAIGRFPEKSAAVELIRLLTSDEESQQVRDAAASGLSTLSGETYGTRDVQRWTEWWSTIANLSDADAHRALVEARAARVDDLERQVRGLRDAAERKLSDLYRQMPADARPALLLGYLQDGDPDIRAIGTRITVQEKQDARPIREDVRRQLATMVSDDSPRVRLEVARALRVINYPEALGALLAQLAVERDADVKAEIVGALAPIQDLQAVDPLLKLVRDSDVSVARAAAEALRSLGPRLADDPPRAATAAYAIRATFDSTSGARPGRQELRESTLAALVPLRQSELAPLFQSLLKKTESPEVRRQSILGLAAIGNSDNADDVVRWLNDRDQRVRYAAVGALRTIGTSAHAVAVAERLSESEESDETVRAAAWATLQDLMRKMTAAQLNDYVDRFKADPSASPATAALLATRRLAALQLQREKLRAAGQRDDLASCEESIGEAYLRDLAQPADAIEHYRAALEHWRAEPSTPAIIIVRLRGNLMRSYLRAGKFPEAIDFASESIRADSAYAQTMGSLIREEADRLSASNPQSALQLIDVARAMSNPSLPATTVDQLAQIANAVKLKAAQPQNRGPDNAAPQNASVNELGR